MTVKISAEKDHTMCQISLAVAVCENGKSDCCIIEGSWLSKKVQYENWLNEKRRDNYLWTIRSINVMVPLPKAFGGEV